MDSLELFVIICIFSVLSITAISSLYFAVKTLINTFQSIMSDRLTQKRVIRKYNIQMKRIELKNQIITFKTCCDYGKEKAPQECQFLLAQTEFD